MPYYPPVFDLRSPPTAPVATLTPPASHAAVAPAVILPKPPPPPAAVRIKTEAPAGYAPPTRRGGHHEQAEINPTPYVERGSPTKTSSLYWKVGAAAVLVLAVGAGAIVRPYLTDRPKAAIVPTSAPAAVAPEQKPAVAAAVGSLSLVTQPAGARVLLDGAPAGETPLTIESVSPGRHTITFVTTSGSVRKTVRVEAGKTASLDVPVYSGWIAVFAPVLLEIEENGRSIGTSEQGRLMLTPGRHQLTFSNRDLGFTSSETVDVEPGEERSVNIQPTGELSLNALPWAEVWIDGKKAGDTPLANLRVPLGTHEIVFKNPQYPDRRLTTTVRANTPSAAAVDFTKNP
jgi:serine/threonine-protein kinase